MADAKIGIEIEVNTKELPKLQQELEKTKIKVGEIGNNVGNLEGYLDKGISKASIEAAKNTANLTKAMGALGIGIGAAGAALAAWSAFKTAASEAVIDLVKSSTAATNAMTELGRRVGASNPWLSQLAFAANRSHVSLEQLHIALATMNEKAAQQPEVFQKMGISVRDYNGAIKPTQQLVSEIADRIKGLGTSSERAEVAFQLFGRAGKEMAPLFEGGSAGLAEMAKRADELGITISKQSELLAGKFHESMTETEGVLEAVNRAIADDVIPAFLQGLEAAKAFLGALVTFVKQNDKAIRELAVQGLQLMVRGFSMSASAAGHLASALGFLLGVFTDRYEKAFRMAHDVAMKFSDAADGLVEKLGQGAKLTEDRVIPSVEKETGAHIQLTKALSDEQKARANLGSTVSDKSFALQDLIVELASKERDRGNSALEAAKDEQAAAASSLAFQKNNAEEFIKNAEQLNTKLESLRKERSAMLAEMSKAQANPGQFSKVDELLGRGLSQFMGAANKDVDRLNRSIYQTQTELQHMAEFLDQAKSQLQEADARREKADAAELAAEIKLADSKLMIAREYIAKKAAMTDAAQKQAEEVEKRNAESLNAFIEQQISHGGITGLISAANEARRMENQVSVTEFKKTSDKIEQRVDETAQRMGEGLGSTLVDLAHGAASFGDIMSGVLTNIEKQIISMMATAAIQLFLKSFLGLSGGGEVKAGGSSPLGFIGKILGFASGGPVPSNIGTPGRDSVPAFLTPGEYVLPVDVVRRIKGGSGPSQNGHYSSGGAVYSGSAASTGAYTQQTTLHVQTDMHVFSPLSQAEFERMYRDKVLPAVNRLSRLAASTARTA